jgi:gluconolactonase
VSAVRADTHNAIAGPGFRIQDPAFEAVLGDHPRLVRVLSADAHEGPVYLHGEDALYFTSVPWHDGPGRAVVDIRRLALDGMRFPLSAGHLRTVAPDAGAANGMTASGDGRLIVCQQGDAARPAQIALLDPVGGDVETLVADVDGLPLSSPNDVVVGPDGCVWFTDPSYGHLQGFRPPPRMPDRVYRCDPATGRVTVAADDLDKPNGVALSPDGATLYVTDSGANQEPGSFHQDRPHEIRAYDVDGGAVGAGRRLAVTTDGIPDGLKVDALGNVYASCAHGVQVFAAQGRLVGEIVLPGAINFCFGGPDRDVLFITTDTAVWAAVLGVAGLAPAVLSAKGA